MTMVDGRGECPIRVLIADDHPVVRAGIAGMIGRHHDMVVVGEVADGAGVMATVDRAVPDVLILDLNMPGLDPITMTRCLRQKPAGPRVLVLSAYDDDAYINGLLAAGATGYVLKDEALDNLAAAVRAVAAGEFYLSQRIACRLARQMAMKADKKPEPITAREKEILRLLALGLPNEEIAVRLSIAKRTVQNHVSNIYAKLDLVSRTEAVLYAIRQGLVDPNEVVE